MRIKNIKLTNYRNYDLAEVDFSNGITLISGANGQGKTNLVESLVIASTTKSPRTSSLQETIKDGKDVTRVNIIVERNYGDVEISYIIDNKGDKKFFINGNPVVKMGEVFGNVVIIYFCPDHLKIVSASPAERRDFMDTDISQLSGTYYNLLQRYNKILMQRNKLLKTERDRSVLLSMLSVYNEQLASVASLIIKTRKGFLEKLKLPAKEAMKYISSSKDELDMEYVGVRGESAEEIKRELLKSLEYNTEKDIELGYTSVGPHRDDIYLSLSGKDARSYSSQGQQRSIVLALKFAEMEIFKNELNENPILVLDDVFSELDTTRQRRLYEKMSQYQTIMTGTSFKFKPASDYDQLVVKQGKIQLKRRKDY